MSDGLLIVGAWWPQAGKGGYFANRACDALVYAAVDNQR